VAHRPIYATKKCVGLNPQDWLISETKIFSQQSLDGLAAITMSIPQKRPRTDERSEKRKQTSRSTKNAFPDSAIVASKGGKRPWRNRKAVGSSEGVDGAVSQKRTSNVNSWGITKICGGRFTPKSLFSKDEKYLSFQ
jgi:hypothetical protein